jgi:succinoglycan biosynthesis transport protein ExoP
MKNHKLLEGGLPGGSANASTTLLLRAGEHDSPDLAFLDIWRILLKRRGLISCCAAGLGIAALGLSLLMTPHYAATATVQVNAQNADLLGTDGQAAGLGSDSFESSVVMQTEVQILQSDALALQVATELDLEKVPPFAGKKTWKSWLRLPSFSTKKRRPADFRVPLEKSPERRAAVLTLFRQNLKAGEVQGTRIIQVQFLNPDPAIAAKVVNTLVSDYIDQHYRTRYTATIQASGWLSKELTQLKKQVQDSQERVVKYQRDNGIFGGADETHNVTLVKLADLNSRLTAVESNRIIKEAIYHLSLGGNPEIVVMI